MVSVSSLNASAERQWEVNAPVLVGQGEFRLMADMMPDVLFLCGADGSCEFNNQRFCELTGLAPERARGQGWIETIHPEDIDAVRQAWRHARQTGQAFETRYRLRLANGSYQWFLSRGRPIREDGRIVHWIGTATNIHELVRAEQSWQQADRHKDQFIALLAHELRNPLAAIRNAVQVLQLLESPDAEVVEMREIIHRQVRHMSRLVEGLLDVSRIARGKIQLERQLVDVSDLASKTANDHRATIESKALVLEVDVPPQPAWVKGDATRLAEVLGNLLDNAVKFTPAGGRLTVKVEPEVEKGDVRINVADTGIGMAPETLERLFEPFLQADRSLTRAHGGLGLGLALVKGLVHLHGGRIAATSEGLGTGSEFCIRLPLAEPGEASRDGVNDAVEGKMAFRILVIDDSEDTLRATGRLLSMLGHEVAVAADGKSGVETARQFRPDVVLCDIALPGELDGYAVGRTLRQDPSLRSALLIAITGYAQEEDKSLASQAGFDAHLSKPVDPTHLEQVLYERC